MLIFKVTDLNCRILLPLLQLTTCTDKILYRSENGNVRTSAECQCLIDKLHNNITVINRYGELEMLLKEEKRIVQM